MARLVITNANGDAVTTFSGTLALATPFGSETYTFSCQDGVSDDPDIVCEANTVIVTISLDAAYPGDTKNIDVVVEEPGGSTFSDRVSVSFREQNCVAPPNCPRTTIAVSMP